MEPTIVAIGGGGLGPEPESRLLDEYLLALTGKASPKACFIPTASGDSVDYIVRFYTNFTVARCQPSHLALFFRTMDNVRDFLLDQDLIYVGGGNTAAMLAIWRQHGVDAILREAWQNGTVLCGASAGANCWFEACSTDSFGPGLAPLNDGLGFLPGSFCPHYDGEVNRKPTLRRFMDERLLPGGYAADNYAGIRWTGTTLTEAIASKETARVYRVDPAAGGMKEEEIVPRYLG